VRQHVQLVLGFDAHKQKWKDLLEQRREMMIEVNSKNNQLNEADKAAGVVIVVKKVSYKWK